MNESFGYLMRTFEIEEGVKDVGKEPRSGTLKDLRLWL